MTSESHVIITFDGDFYRNIIDKIRRRLVKTEVKSTEELEKNLNSLLESFKKSVKKKEKWVSDAISVSESAVATIKNKVEAKNNLFEERNKMCYSEGRRVLEILRNLEPDSVDEFGRARIDYFNCISSTRALL